MEEEIEKIEDVARQVRDNLKYLVGLLNLLATEDTLKNFSIDSRVDEISVPRSKSQVVNDLHFPSAIQKIQTTVSELHSLLDKLGSEINDFDINLEDMLGDLYKQLRENLKKQEER